MDVDHECETCGEDLERRELDGGGVEWAATDPTYGPGELECPDSEDGRHWPENMPRPGEPAAHPADEAALLAVKVEELEERHLMAEPVTVSWTDDGEAWYEAVTMYYGTECPSCGAAATGRSGDTSCDDCGFVWDPSEDDPDAGVPMMNYAYPANGADVDEAAVLVHLPLTLLEVEDFPGLEDGTYLALTGGGMDLSWEIVEAYVRLGMLPPAHFCRLPGMAGRGTSPGDRKLLEVAAYSLRQTAERYRWRVQGLDADAGRLEEQARAGLEHRRVPYVDRGERDYYETIDSLENFGAQPDADLEVVRLGDGPDGELAVPARCHDCRRPMYYDTGDETYRHAVDAAMPCFLIPADDRPDDLEHQLAAAWLEQRGS